MKPQWKTHRPWRKPQRSKKFDYPLVKVDYVITGAGDLFARDRVMLVCGHEAMISNGAMKGRCRKCHEEKLNSEQNDKTSVARDSASSTSPGHQNKSKREG